MIVVIFIGINFLGYLNQPQEITKYAVIYMGIVGLSALPLMIYQTYKQFIEGFSIMKPAMIIALLANVINIFGNWILIFGKLGFPALGLAGAAWSTFISRVFMASAMIIYVMKNEKFKDYDVNLHFRGLNLAVIKNNSIRDTKRFSEFL